MPRQVNYSLDMANTWEDLYAHVDIEGVDIGPGDAIKLHQVPVELPYGHKKSVKGHASYFKASAMKRWFIKTFSRFEITMLYEVSFSSTRFSKQRHEQINQHIENKRRIS